MSAKTSTDPTPLSPEDTKLVTLARATKARTGKATGAALRDSDGRTYAAAEVDLPHLQISAVGVCVAMASSSGSAGVEAVVVLGADTIANDDVVVVGEFAGSGVPVMRCTMAGKLAETQHTF